MLVLRCVRCAQFYAHFAHVCSIYLYWPQVVLFIVCCGSLLQSACNCNTVYFKYGCGATLSYVVVLCYTLPIQRINSNTKYNMQLIHVSVFLFIISTLQYCLRILHNVHIFICNLFVRLLFIYVCNIEEYFFRAKAKTSI